MPALASLLVLALLSDVLVRKQERETLADNCEKLRRAVRGLQTSQESHAAVRKLVARVCNVVSLIRVSCYMHRDFAIVKCVWMRSVTQLAISFKPPVDVTHSVVS